jgi:hypothetical protein
MKCRALPSCARQSLQDSNCGTRLDVTRGAVETNRLGQGQKKIFNTGGHRGAQGRKAAIRTSAAKAVFLWLAYRSAGSAAPPKSAFDDFGSYQVAGMGRVLHGHLERYYFLPVCTVVP